MPEFYMIFAPKINKIPEFYVIYARKNNKMPEIYMIFFSEKNILWLCARIWGDAKHTCPLPPSPTPMAAALYINDFIFCIQECMSA